MFSARFVCLFACQRDYGKTTGPIFIATCWKGVAWVKEEAIQFWAGPKHAADTHVIFTGISYQWRGVTFPLSGAIAIKVAVCILVVSI